MRKPKVKLTHKQKDNLFNFEGYGNREAPIWFLGMEEKLPKDKGANIPQEFRIRAKFQPVMDLYDAHCQLKRCVLSMKKMSQVWLWMAKIARWRDKPASDWKGLQKAKDYVSSKKLGAKDSKDTFLIEFSPVPASSRGKDGWTGFHRLNFGSREEYENRVRQTRLDRIRDLLRHNTQPKYLFAYGKSNWKQYCELLNLEETEFTSIKGTDDRVRIKRTDTGTIILLPFLGNGCISTENVRRLFEELESSR